jgi:hypothetical protein
MTESKISSKVKSTFPALKYFLSKSQNLNIQVPTYIPIAKNQVGMLAPIPSNFWKEGGSELGSARKKELL